MSITANVSDQQAGQSANASGEGAQVQEQQQAQLTAQIRAAIAEELDSRDRKQQSARDKQEARFNKTFTEMKAALAAANIELQPDQLRVVEQRVRQSANVNEDVSTGNPAQDAGKEQPGSGKATTEADTFAAHLEEAFGVELTDADPEAAKVKEAKTLPEYKKAYREALEVKRERMAQADKQNAANRLVGAGSGGQNAESVETLTGQLTELLKNPSPQNKSKIIELQGRLKKLNQ